MDEANPSDLAQLLEALHTGRAHERRAAMQLLAARGVEAELAVPALVELLHASDLSLRTAAADALTQLGPLSVPHLLAALATDDADSRKAIVVTLGNIGPDAKDAIPVLMELVDDEWLQYRVFEALRNIQGGDRLILLHLLGRLSLLYAGLFGIFVGVLVVWLWVRGGPLPTPSQAALSAGAALAILGASMGPILGYRSWSGRKLALMTALLGIGGGMTGYLLGGLLATLVEPLVRILGR